MAVFERLALAQFVRRVSPRLRATFPDALKSVGEEQLAALIESGVVRARSHGIEDEPDVEAFLGFLVQYGEGFGRKPPTLWAGPVLGDDTLDGEQKLQRLQDLEAFAADSD